MEQLRVLQFVNILDRGGTESFIFNNLDVMERDVVNFDFLVTRDQIEPREEDLYKYGCKKIIIPMKSGNRFSSYINLYRDLKKYFKSCSYSVIHFESNPPGIMATAATLAAYKAGIKVRILHSHGAGGEQVSFSKLRPIITRLCRFINVKTCTYFMAPSLMSAIYGFGTKVANSDKCLIIKNPVKIEGFLYNPSKREYYRRELGISAQTTLIGTVGRISEVKNQLFMVSIFNEYLKINPDSYLILVGGTAPDSEGVEKEIKSLVDSMNIKDKVIFYGESKDVPGILNSFDAFLMTSRSEALGIAAIEAQINGLPVFIAENGIPKDVEITSHMYWLNLNDSPEKWARIIDYNMIESKERVIDVNTRNVQSVNVVHTAKTLQDKYLELVDED